MELHIFIVALIACVSAASVSVHGFVHDDWHVFKQEHGKSYGHEIEEEFRRKIFLDNKREIEQHNEKFKKGLVSYEMGLNQFADLLHSEFVQMMNGYKHIKNDKENLDEKELFMSSSNQSLPAEIDWREKGAVTKVKDQGKCGSCWAFSATGVLEGQHFLKTGQLVELSEQNLMDCTFLLYGNLGCYGGMPSRALNYVKQNGGIDTEESYPYKEQLGWCSFDPSNIGATEKEVIYLPTGDEDKLKETVATFGPVSVAIDARHIRFYKSGVFHDESCSSTQLDHAVLVVGYGTDHKTGKDYWIVKNSWGPKWGDNGYLKMTRNGNNNCGIATIPVVPRV